MRSRDLLKNDEQNIYQIGFANGMFCVVKSKSGYTSEIRDREYPIQFDPSWSEVIGNIYENADLLRRMHQTKSKRHAF